MPTRRGRVTLIAAGALYLLAWLGSIGELYSLSLAAVAFPLAAAAFVRLRGHRITFARTVGPARIFAGGSVRFTVSVANSGRLPSPPLQLDDPAPPALGGALRFAVPSVRARAAESFTVERRVALRGRSTVGPMRARVVDPFGMAEVSADVAPAATVVVFPRIETIAERQPHEARGGTGRSSLHRMASAGEEFYAVRDWQEGDDLRKIHWRSTARRGELMIRQDEVRPFPRATIIIDTRASAHRGDATSSSLEWSVSAAASVVWELARQGFALRLATADSGPGGERWGREATDPLLGTLAVVERSGARSLQGVVRRAAARPGAGGALLAILPPPSPDIIGPLSRLRRAYAWCGAVLLDTASFSGAFGRERALFDQRLAEADRALERAGWRVVVAGSSDRFRTIWQRLIEEESFRPSSPSARS